MKNSMIKTLTLCLTLITLMTMLPQAAFAANVDLYTCPPVIACTFGLSKPQVIEWEQMMMNYNFPTYVLRNVVYECQAQRGVPINQLGLVPTKGSNLRSSTSYANNRNIIMKIHGNETVYVYFSLYDSNGGLWYYAVTSSGMEGYLAAVRIMLDRSWGVSY